MNLHLLIAIFVMIWAFGGGLFWLMGTAEDRPYRLIDSAKLSMAQLIFVQFLCGPLVWLGPVFRFLGRLILRFWRFLGTIGPPSSL